MQVQSKSVSPQEGPGLQSKPPCCQLGNPMPSHKKLPDFRGHVWVPSRELTYALLKALFKIMFLF